MFKRLIFPAVVAVCLAAPVALFAQGATTTCADGTKSSATGKGACSGHGGVKKQGTKTTSSKSQQGGEKKEASEPKSVSSSSAKGSDKGEKGEKQVKCGDGSMSAGGKGACSHHGGVAKGGESESKGNSSASGASAPKSLGESHEAADKDNGKAEGATAKCKDGSYSHAKQHSGACSKHGGVDKWLDGSK